jgi:ribonuclease Y
VVVNLIIAGAGLICTVIAAFISFKKGVESRKKKAEASIGSAEAESQRIIAKAEKQGEAKKREYLLEVREEVHKTRVELDKEIKERRVEISRQERRLDQKEENLDKKTEAIEKRESEHINQVEALEEEKKEIAELKSRQLDELEKIAGLSIEEAKELMLRNLEDEVRHEMAMLVSNLHDEAKNEADKNAKNILAIAIQKSAADHISETSVSVVQLPNDEMKGRIIGREGRNIRTLETLTGIELIIDDTPEAVVLSGFDPIRREIARIALEKLILDGRIHPARIEEMVEKAKKEVENTIKQEGEKATFEAGVHGIHPEIMRLLGRLKYRTSYGQNALIHSIEVSRLAGLLAAELGEDIKLAKRAGLLHDIGKSVDYEMEGSHVNIGADLAKKYHENKTVLNSILSHHGDVEPNCIISVLIQAADTISAARPGARKETLESYIKRIEKLEEIADTFPGVEKSYAIQAGREIRILVKPEEVKDDGIILTARELVKKIEKDLEYPGQIKVNVIRETRAIEYAK